MAKFEFALVSCKVAEEDASTETVQTAVALSTKYISVVESGRRHCYVGIGDSLLFLLKLHFMKQGKGKAFHHLYRMLKRPS